MIVAELDAAQFSIIEAATAKSESAHLAGELIQALSADELVTALVPVLHRVQAAAIELITVKTSQPPLASYREWKGNDVDEARAQLETLQARDQSEGTRTRCN